MTSLLLLLLVSSVSSASASLACTSCTVELRKSVATQPFSLCLSLWQLDKADTAIRKHACQYDECALHPHLQHQPTATASVQCYACVDRCDCPDFSCDIHRGRSHFTVLLRSHGLRKHTALRRGLTRSLAGYRISGAVTVVIPCKGKTQFDDDDINNRIYTIYMHTRTSV